MVRSLADRTFQLRRLPRARAPRGGRPRVHLGEEVVEGGALAPDERAGVLVVSGDCADSPTSAIRLQAA